jgi:long-subunit acyl-CoA synthetase (AMP-forming)
MDVDIRDESARTVPVGESGEIWMKSPTLIRGYWNKPDATAETIVEGGCAPGTSATSARKGFSSSRTERRT